MFWSKNEVLEVMQMTNWITEICGLMCSDGTKTALARLIAVADPGFPDWDALQWPCVRCWGQIVGLLVFMISYYNKSIVNIDLIRRSFLYLHKGAGSHLSRI